MADVVASVCVILCLSLSLSVSLCVSLCLYYFASTRHIYVAWGRPFLEHLRGEGADVSSVWARVESALVKTVLTAQALQRLPKRHPGSCTATRYDIYMQHTKRKHEIEEKRSSSTVFILHRDSHTNSGYKHRISILYI